MNRGVAIAGKFFVCRHVGCPFGCPRCARSGAVRWDAEVADYKTGHCITLAPLAIDGKDYRRHQRRRDGDSRIHRCIRREDPANVCGDSGPCPEKASRATILAWRGFLEDWRRTDVGYRLLRPRSQLDLLGHWKSGIPIGIAILGGDNLYTCSLVALDAYTGKLKWYFQFTPHDTHD